MKRPKTINGYMALLKRVSAIPLYEIRGYDKLDREEQVALGAISADIDNGIQEFERQREFTKKPAPEANFYCAMEANFGKSEQCKKPCGDCQNEG